MDSDTGKVGAMALVGVLTRFPRAVVSRGDRILPTGRPRVLIAALAMVLALGTASGAAILAWSTSDTIRTEQAGQQAVAAVRDLAPKLLNFDHRTIDADMARAKSVTTGEYWAENGLAKNLKPALVKQQASTETIVQAAGVAQAQPDRVVVLVFLNQTTKGKNLSAPRVDSRVAKVTTTQVDGKWLVAGFEPL